MRRRSLFLLVGSLSALALLFCSGLTTASAHATCSISRILYVPAAGNTAATESIFIDHTHLGATPESTNPHAHQYRLRGLHRNFSVAGYYATILKTNAVDAASLAAPPRYTSPVCLYPQHNYLFRLTPF